MSPLSVRLKQYIAMRRSLGFDLFFAERVLRKFAEFAERERADHITTDLFLRWKEHYGSANNLTWMARLSMVRVFAGWLQGFDARTEVPPRALITSRPRRTRPYIYKDDQIAEIVAEAARLPSSYGLRGWTCSTLFGLIAVTGLRVNEALDLDEEEVDLKQGVLTICRAKNRKSRFVPISPGATERLRAYRAERNRILGAGRAAFFLLENGERLTDCCARYNFAVVCQRIGLRAPQSFNKHGRGPRIHDLRHTFAVRTIMDWYRRGLDPDREMLKLSTYLGHARLSSPTGTSRQSRNCCGLLANVRNDPGRRGAAMKGYPLPIYVQRFFTERLATQLHASPNTVASYRDTFRLLLRYAADRLRREANPASNRRYRHRSDRESFLTFVETGRGKAPAAATPGCQRSARSSSTSPAMSRNFCINVSRYWRCPPSATRNEPLTSSPAPRSSSHPGRRSNDAIGASRSNAPSLALQTGFRVSELINLTCADVVLGTGTSRAMHGQGTKRADHTAQKRLCGSAPRVAC